MTCHCSSPAMHAQRAADDAARYTAHETATIKGMYEAELASYKQRAREFQERSPDPDDFEIVQAEEFGAHLVMTVRYPGCVRCSYDQKKTMVFLHCGYRDALLWKRIDPHFREPGTKTPTGQAWSPAARFPGSPEGWADAVAYARSKR